MGEADIHSDWWLTARTLRNQSRGARSVLFSEEAGVPGLRLRSRAMLWTAWRCF